MKKLALIMTISGLCFTLGFFVGRITHGMRTEIVETDVPLYLMSEEPPGAYVLPPKTTLYFDRTDKKKGTIYRMYIRLEDEPFKTKQAEHNWFLAPTTAFRTLE